MKTSLIWGKKQTSKSMSHREIQSNSTKTSQHRDIIVKFANYRDKERILKETNKGKEIPKLQEMANQAHSKPLQRNQSGQKGVAWYITCTDGERYLAKNTLSSKAVIQNRKKVRVFQTNSKGVHDHQTSTARNIKGDPLSGEGRPKAKKTRKQKNCRKQQLYR